MAGTGTPLKESLSVFTNCQGAPKIGPLCLTNQSTSAAHGFAAQRMFSAKWRFTLHTSDLLQRHLAS